MLTVPNLFIFDIIGIGRAQTTEVSTGVQRIPGSFLIYLLVVYLMTLSLAQTTECRMTN